MQPKLQLFHGQKTLQPYNYNCHLYKWFFIEYWIKTGLDFYPGPFFILSSTSLKCMKKPAFLQAGLVKKIFLFLEIIHNEISHFFIDVVSSVANRNTMIFIGIVTTFKVDIVLNHFINHHY